ncbi:DUF6382 domain-containing protein [Paenibacillaceae sp. P-4]|uniref:DUF6382 domain-containing protein n=1 Tax=Paenibacillaceae bacterium P-4 TaxID=3160969 RepID=UPI0032E804A4
MNQQIYGITYELLQDQGNVLVFGHDGQLSGSALMNLQVQMLQSNSIPRLLPVSIEEFNLSAQLRYDVASKRPLLQVLSSAPIRLLEYYELLFQIVSALEDNKTYMLLEQNYVLHENFIYVGTSIQDVHLCYLPVKELANKRTVAEEIRDLAMSLIGYVREVKGEGFQRILNYCRTEAFRISDLKKLLKNNIQEIHEEAYSSPVHQPSPAPSQGANGHPSAEREYAAAQEGSRLKRTTLQASEVPAAQTKPKSMNQEEVGSLLEVRAYEPLQQRGKIVLILLLVLTNAILLKLYLDDSREGMMLICLGLSLLAFDAAYIFVKFRHLWFGAKVQGQGESINSKQPRPSKKVSKKGKNVVVHSEDVEPKQIQFEKKINIQEGKVQPDSIDPQYYQNLSMQTTLLRPDTSQETVLLDQGMSPLHGQKPPILEVRKGDHVMQQVIHMSSYRIGRDGTAVQHVEDLAGVSRVHLEIKREENDWYAVDLNSKNGSVLNGEAMTANQPYVLRDGDVIKIITTEFVFRTE